MANDSNLSIIVHQECTPGPRRGDFPTCQRERLLMPPLRTAPVSSGLWRLGGDTAWCERWTHGLHGGNASMVAELWQQARLEAGLPPLDAAAVRHRQEHSLPSAARALNQQMSVESATHTAGPHLLLAVMKFFAFKLNGLLWPGQRRCSASHGALVYLPVWKAGSTVLTSAAQAAFQRHGAGATRAAAAAAANGSQFAFTFVREPLEHLISGAAEVAWRISKPGAAEAPWSADDFLAALLDARYPEGGSEEQPGRLVVRRTGARTPRPARQDRPTLPPL